MIGTSNKVLKRSLNFSFSPKGVNKPNKQFLDVVEEQSLQQVAEAILICELAEFGQFSPHVVDLLTASNTYSGDLTTKLPKNTGL